MSTVECGREYILKVVFVSDHQPAQPSPWRIRGPTQERNFEMAQRWRIAAQGKFLYGSTQQIVIFCNNYWGKENMPFAEESEPVKLTDREIEQLNQGT